MCSFRGFSSLLRRKLREYTFNLYLKITHTSSLKQQRHTETHTHMCTQTGDNLISRVFMDEGVESEVQWPAGSQRLKYRER